MTLVHPLLVELLTEELPPKNLRRLGEAFAKKLRMSLAQHNLLSHNCKTVPYVSPRRLAVLLTQVFDQAPDRFHSEEIVPVSDNNWEENKVIKTSRSQTAPGITLEEGLQKALISDVNDFSAAKLMRYQLKDGTTVKFMRPVHGLVALHGTKTVAVQAFGLIANRNTFGHRYLGVNKIVLKSADSYERQLLESGYVIASFSARKTEIKKQLDEKAARLGYTLGNKKEVSILLEEVTALVEYPTVYVGQFDKAYLRIPSECLALTIQSTQKCFPLLTLDEKCLTNYFLIVSNMKLAEPLKIIEGNQRVMDSRLADAQFFFDLDCKVPLFVRVPTLKNIVYHNRLGTNFDRVQRIRKISFEIARQLNADPSIVDRATLLAKADLSTDMVSEFPELQGIMGAHYANLDGEPKSVVEAIRNQYRHRVSMPITDNTLAGVILFVADRIETLVGLWSIGFIATSDHDPFALRRAALGLISAFEQLEKGGYLKSCKDCTLTIQFLLQLTKKIFEENLVTGKILNEIHTFIYERYSNQLFEEFKKNVVESVVTLRPPLHQVRARVQAVSEFCSLPVAIHIAKINKRAMNIFKKREIPPQLINPGLLSEPAEIELVEVLTALEKQIKKLLISENFLGALSELKVLKKPVDDFFSRVTIMEKDQTLRKNRLAILSFLHSIMCQVAEISYLAL